MKTLVCVCVLIAIPNAVCAQSFQGVPFLSGEQTNGAKDLSGDGSTVVGFGAQHAMRWRAGAATEDLGSLPALFSTGATGTSTDGSVVVGTASDQVVNITAFRWTQPSGMVALPNFMFAINTSGDGSTVIGYTEPGTSDIVARRWTPTGGTQGLGPLSGTPFGLGRAASASAANADGSIITGYARVTTSLTPPSGTVISTPFIWDATNGARTLPLPNGTLLPAVPSDITPSGAIIVGTDVSTPTDRIFRWSADTGYQFFAPAVPLNALLGEPRTSADGNAIVAGLNYWSPGTGVITIQQLLTNSGCDFTGWTLSGAVGISDDGMTIAGNGTNPQGQTEAWVATIPAPGVGGVVAIVIACMPRRRVALRTHVHAEMCH